MRGARRSAAARRYVGQLHIELVVVLLVICVALSLFGWLRRPQSTAFPSLPQGLWLTVSGTPREALTETITVGTTGAKLLLSAPAAELGASGPPWSAAVWNLGAGRVCTPREVVFGGAALSALSVPGQRVRRVTPRISVDPGLPTSYTDVSSRGFVYLSLCWARAAPAAVDGAYLSAAFPPVYGGGATRTVQLTRVLRPESDTADYAVQSTPPDGAAAGRWTWSRTGASSTLSVSAVDATKNQGETYRAFLSGIAFGVAGGAVITLLQELLTPLSRRRDERRS